MELLKCEFVQTEFLGCTFSWHQGREKSQISMDCNYFSFKHKHYLLIKAQSGNLKHRWQNLLNHFSTHMCVTTEAHKIF